MVAARNDDMDLFCSGFENVASRGEGCLLIGLYTFWVTLAHIGSGIEGWGNWFNTGLELGARHMFDLVADIC